MNNGAEGSKYTETGNLGAITVSDNGLNFIANHEVNINTLVLDSGGKIIEIKPSNNTTIGYGYDLIQDPLNLGIDSASNISAEVALVNLHLRLLIHH
jgi:hypothetical protein